MDVFRLPEAMANEIVEHAQAEYPKEACGMIVGPVGHPTRLVRLTNVDPDPVMRYLADPKEVKKIHDLIDDEVWEVLSVYHSHTHSPAFPSPTDVERVGYPDAVYALVSLADRAQPDLRAFRIIDGTITELQVVTDQQATAG